MLKAGLRASPTTRPRWPRQPVMKWLASAAVALALVVLSGDLAGFAVVRCRGGRDVERRPARARQGIRTPCSRLLRRLPRRRCRGRRAAARSRADRSTELRKRRTRVRDLRAADLLHAHRSRRMAPRETTTAARRRLSSGRHRLDRQLRPWPHRIVRTDELTAGLRPQHPTSTPRVVQRRTATRRAPRGRPGAAVRAKRAARATAARPQART